MTCHSSLTSQITSFKTLLTQTFFNVSNEIRLVQVIKIFFWQSLREGEREEKYWQLQSFLRFTQTQKK